MLSIVTCIDLIQHLLKYKQIFNFCETNDISISISICITSVIIIIKMPTFLFQSG